MIIAILNNRTTIGRARVHMTPYCTQFSRGKQAACPIVYWENRRLPLSSKWTAIREPPLRYLVIKKREAIMKWFT